MRKTLFPCLLWRDGQKKRKIKSKDQKLKKKRKKSHSHDGGESERAARWNTCTAWFEMFYLPSQVALFCISHSIYQQWHSRRAMLKTFYLNIYLWQQYLLLIYNFPHVSRPHITDLKNHNTRTFESERDALMRGPARISLLSEEWSSGEQCFLFVYFIFGLWSIPEQVRLDSPRCSTKSCLFKTYNGSNLHLCTRRFENTGRQWLWCPEAHNFLVGKLPK